LKSWNEGAAEFESSSLHKNQSFDKKYGTFWLENQLRLSLDFSGVPCIDDFTIGLYKQRKKLHHNDSSPLRHFVYFFMQSFASFWLFLIFYSFERGNLFGCMSFSYPPRHSSPTILLPANFL
jgi:hypothetical protein